VDPDYQLPTLSWGPLGAPAHSFRLDGLSSLTGAAATLESVAAVRGACQGTSSGGLTRRAVVALDLDDLSARGYLPVRDPFGDYTCGSQLQAVAWLDADTVLLSAAALGQAAETRERVLVSWDVETGVLARVSTLRDALAYDVAATALVPVPQP
jgi:hypothetical protein